MFLKLTYHDNGKTLYVNSDHIVTMGSHNEVTSRIGLIGDNEAFEVSESLDQIMAMLNPPSSPSVWLGDPDKFMEEWRRLDALGRRLDAPGVRGSLEPSQTKTMNYGAAPVPEDADEGDNPFAKTDHLLLPPSLPLRRKYSIELVEVNLQEVFKVVRSDATAAIKAMREGDYSAAEDRIGHIVTTTRNLR